MFTTSCPRTWSGSHRNHYNLDSVETLQFRKWSGFQMLGHQESKQFPKVLDPTGISCQIGLLTVGSQLPHRKLNPAVGWVSRSFPPEVVWGSSEEDSYTLETFSEECVYPSSDFTGESTGLLALHSWGLLLVSWDCNSLGYYLTHDLHVASFHLSALSSGPLLALL